MKELIQLLQGLVQYTRRGGYGENTEIYRTANSLLVLLNKN